MTVKELIELLRDQNPDAIVVMSKDSEGNSYSPFSSLWAGSYLAETTWGGKVGLSELTPKDKKMGYGEEDVIDGEAAVILQPTN